MAGADDFDVDLGPMVVFRCPDCFEVGVLRLCRTQSVGGLISLLIAKLRKPDYAAVCDRCNWPTKLELENEDEIDALFDLVELTKQFVSETAPDTKAYYTDILNVAPRVLDQLRISGENWRCESCGEQNTAIFEKCWKCSTAAPEGAPQHDAEDHDLSGRYLNGPSLPWEGF